MSPFLFYRGHVIAFGGGGEGRGVYDAPFFSGQVYSLYPCIGGKNFNSIRIVCVNFKATDIQYEHKRTQHIHFHFIEIVYDSTYRTEYIYNR